MKKEIIKLSESSMETMLKADKALLVLCDLLDRYNYVGEHPTKQEANRLSIETERIISYIDIAIDYVHEIKNGMKGIADDIEVLFEELRTNDTVKSDVNGDFMQYVYARTAKALQENEEYMSMEHNNADPNALQAKAEELCYMQGFNDAMQLVTKGADHNSR